MSSSEPLLWIKQNISGDVQGSPVNCHYVPLCTYVLWHCLDSKVPPYKPVLLYCAWFCWSKQFELAGLAAWKFGGINPNKMWRFEVHPLQSFHTHYCALYFCGKKGTVAISKEKSTGALKPLARTTLQTSGSMYRVGERCEEVHEMY